MCHVLIIEDEVLVAMDLQDMLEAEGATSFDVAATEAEAVAAARAHPPQFISSDVRLAEGTGPGAVRTITAEQGDVPVMFVTASPEACDACECHTVILRKPVRRASVAETFRLLAPL